jgi:hypothetical protein
MDITESRNLQIIDTIRKAPWLQRSRYSRPITNLFDECDSTEHIWIVGKLIQDFHFIDSERYVDEVTNMANVIENVWGLSPNDTLVTAICDSTKPDGSQSVIRTLEVSLPRSWKASIHNNINVAFSEPKKNIVLVDDFVGSGGKLSPKIDRLLSNLKSKGYEPTLYLLILAGMKSGLDVLHTVVSGNLYCPIIMTKAISDNISDPLERAKAVDAMLELEQKILPVTPFPRKDKFKEYNFGYMLSEAIFCVETLNIPNNVFPIFWKEVVYNEGAACKRYPMFCRR